MPCKMQTTFLYQTPWNWQSGVSFPVEEWAENGRKTHTHASYSKTHTFIRFKIKNWIRKTRKTANSLSRNATRVLWSRSRILLYVHRQYNNSNILLLNTFTKVISARNAHAAEWLSKILCTRLQYIIIHYSQSYRDQMEDFRAFLRLLRVPLSVCCFIFSSSSSSSSYNCVRHRYYGRSSGSSSAV